MNMISTGAFLSEMDASNKQPTIAEKFAAVWEKKNAKAARAGGVSLMALSLAACGGSSSTTTTTSTDTSTDTTTTVTPVSLAATTSADSLVGTAGDDSFRGVVDDNTATNNTLSASDSITGGAGTDTLTVVFDVSAAAVALPAAEISGVENLVVRNISTKTATINLGNMTGEESINIDRSTSQVDVTAIGAGTGVTITGDGTATNGAVNLTYGATVTSNSLTIDGDTTGGAVAITSAKATSLTVDSTGGTNVLTSLAVGAITEDVTINATTNLDFGTGISNIVAATGNTITVSGAATLVDLDTLDADVDTVDASGMTAGGVRFDTPSTTLSFTGGDGADTVNIGTVALGSTASIDGGAGTDTLIITDDTNYTSAIARVSNFEVISLSGSGAVYNMGLISGETAVKLDSTGAITISNIANDLPITVVNSVTGALTATGSNTSGSSDAMTITIDDEDTTAAAITIGAITAAGIETLNLVTSDAMAAGTAHVVSALTGSTAVTTIDVSGTSDLTLTDISVAANSTNGNVHVDATGFAKRLIVNEIDAGDDITGGSGNDTVSSAHTDFGSGTAIHLGAGDDTITYEGSGSTVSDIDFANVTGVENLVVTSATTTSVTLAGYANSAIASVTGNMDVTAASLTTGGTIDASGLAAGNGVDIAVTLTIGTGANGTEALSLTGSSANDTIAVTLDGSADTGDDNTSTAINGGNGIDTISYTISTASNSDIMTITSSASTVANADIITGFNTGTDFFTYTGLTNGGYSAAAAATIQTAGSTLAAGISSLATSNYIITTDIADTAAGNTSGTAFTALLSSTAATLADNYAALEAQLVATGGIFASAITGLDAALTASEAATITIDNGTGSVIMRFTNDTATGNTVTAAELDLIAVITDEVLAIADIV